MNPSALPRGVILPDHKRIAALVLVDMTEDGRYRLALVDHNLKVVRLLGVHNDPDRALVSALKPEWWVVTEPKKEDRNEG